VAGDHAVAEEVPTVQAELHRTVRDERVQLHESPRVRQQVQALARRQLAPRVLPLDTNGTPTLPGFVAHPFNPRHPFRGSGHVPDPSCMSGRQASLHKDAVWTATIIVRTLPVTAGA